MTTVPDTTTEAGQKEASIMLARLCGWEEFSPGVFCLFDDWARSQFVGNLYDPDNMAPAWRVLNWANKTQFGGETTLDQWSWWHNFVADMRLLPPAAAQRAWLDKILSLAIEAGMVQEN